MKNSLIKIDISLYLFLLLCFLAGYLKQYLVLLFIVIFHECGHIFMSFVVGYKVCKIQLYPYGGITLLDKKINSNLNKDLLVAIGGIVFQLLLIIIIKIVYKYISVSTYDLLWQSNIILIIFNLLPIVPLDGSKIVNILLNKFWAFKYSYYITLVVDIIFFICFSMYLYKFKINNIIILLFLVFSLYKYIIDYKYIYNRFLLERLIYELSYSHIKYNTKSINYLRIGVLHYFNVNSRMVNERKIIEDYLNIKR